MVASLVLVQQPIDLFPVFSHSYGQFTWNLENLSVPSRNSCRRVVDRENVHLSIIGDLFHLPDPSFDDKVQADMGHREHELFAEDSNSRLVRQINYLIASLARDHDQVLESINP